MLHCVCAMFDTMYEYSCFNYINILVKADMTTLGKMLALDFCTCMSVFNRLFLSRASSSLMHRIGVDKHLNIIKFHVKRGDVPQHPSSVHFLHLCP